MLKIVHDIKNQKIFSITDFIKNIFKNRSMLSINQIHERVTYIEKNSWKMNPQKISKECQKIQKDLINLGNNNRLGSKSLSERVHILSQTPLKSKITDRTHLLSSRIK